MARRTKTGALIQMQTAVKSASVDKNSTIRSKYDKIVTSFSGADMSVVFLFPDAPPVQVGTASTIGYSVFRQLATVRTMGRITSKGYARGGVTFAGSLVFTVINQSIVESIRQHVDYLGDIATMRADELPPFDIIVTFANEFGQVATLSIYGVSITDETTTFSVEDIFSENVMTFMARDIRQMKAGNPSADLYTSAESLRIGDESVGKFKLSDLFATKEMDEYDNRLEQLKALYNERYKVEATPPRKEEQARDMTDADAQQMADEAKYGKKRSVKIAVTVLGKVLHTFSDGTKSYTDEKQSSYTLYRTNPDGTGKVVIQSKQQTQNVWLEGYPPQSIVIWAEKDGFKSSEKMTLSLTESSDDEFRSVSLQITQIDKDNTQPSNEAVSSKKIGWYPQEDTVYEANGVIDPKRLGIQVFDKNGKPLEGITVTWSFTTDDKGVNFFDKGKGMLSGNFKDHGDFKTTVTNDGGFAYLEEKLDLRPSGGFPYGMKVRIIASVRRYVGDTNTLATIGVSKAWEYKIVKEFSVKQ